MKRIQRDRDEQLAHRQQDSQILIQRNKNMLQDIAKRHGLEEKKTVEFLKYALGNRAPVPAKQIILPSSMYTSKMSRASSPSIKGTKLPAIGGNSSLAGS